MFKKAVMIIGFVLSFGSFAGGDKKLDKKAATSTVKVLGAPKVFVGPQNEKITILALEPKGSDQFILYFEGTGGEWDGEALLHKRLDRGNGGEEFTTQSNGKSWTTLNNQSTWWSGYSIVTGEVKGTGKQVDFSYSKDDSKKVDVNKILEIYSKSKK